MDQPAKKPDTSPLRLLFVFVNHRYKQQIAYKYINQVKLQKQDRGQSLVIQPYPIDKNIDAKKHSKFLVYRVF